MRLPPMTADALTAAVAGLERGALVDVTDTWGDVERLHFLGMTAAGEMRASTIRNGPNSGAWRCYGPGNLAALTAACESDAR